MPSDAFSSALIASGTKRLARTLRTSFQPVRDARSAAIASSSLVSIRGHLYPATNIGDDQGVSTVENVGRPAAAIYQGATGGSTVISVGGSSSGGGGGITIHNELAGRFAANAHPIAAVTNLQFELDSKMLWRGEWSSALDYEFNDVVIDGEWTMIANKATTDRAAPQKLREEEWLYNPLPAFGTGSLTAGTLYTATRIAVTTSGWATGYRVIIPEVSPTLVYQVASIDRTDPANPIIVVNPSFIPTSTGERVMAIQDTILLAGETFDIVLTVTNTAESNTFAGDWNYSAPNNAVVPSTGEIIHANKAIDELRIHKTDDNGGDRSAELGSLGPGDIIIGGAVTWTVQGAVDNGAWITLTITPEVQVSGGVQSFSFTSYAVQPAPYVVADDYWLTNQPDWAAITGVYRIDDAAEVEGNDGYGVDIEFAPASISADWERIAHSAGGSGGGGGDTHAPVTSPLQTITVGGGTGQEIEVNTGKSLTWTVPQTFANDVTIKQSAADYPSIKFENLAGDHYYEQKYNPVSGAFDTRYDGTVIQKFTGTSQVDFYATLGYFHTDLRVDGNQLIQGELDVDDIISSTDLTIRPNGDLELFPGTTDNPNIVQMNGVQQFKDFAGEGPGVYVDWSCDTASKFCEMEVDTLTVQNFKVLSTSVANGEIIVGQAIGELSRELTSPGDDASEVAYFRNIAGDAPIFVDGTDVIYHYHCENGPVSLAANFESSVHAYNQAELDTGGTVIDDQDFEGIALNGIPADYTATGSNNSTSSQPTYWGVSNTVPDSSKTLKTRAPSGNDSNYHIHYTGTGYATLANYEFAGKMYDDGGAVGMGFTVLSDYPNTDTYVRIRSYNGGGMHVANHGYNAPDGGTTTTTWTPPFQTWANFRITIEDDETSRTTLKAKFWNDGDSEPATWMINCWFDGDNRPTEGTAGLWAYQTAGAFAAYDDLVITDLAATYLDAEVTTWVNVTNNTSNLIAVVTTDGSASIVAPTGWALIEKSATINSYNVMLYEFTSPLGIPTDYSWEWSNTIGQEIAVTVVAVRDTVHDGTVTFSTLAQHSSAAYVDSVTALGDGYLELSLVMPLGGNPESTTTDSTGVASHSSTEDYRHKVTKLPLTDKPTIVNHALEEYAGGFTARVSFAPLAGGGTVIGMATAEVTWIDPGDLEDDEQAYTLDYIDAPPAGCTVYPGHPVFNVGLPGQGFWMASAIDGISGGPYDQFVIRGDNPLDWTVIQRTGYLGGLPAVGEFGFWFAQGAQSVEMSEAGAYFNNVNMEWANGENRIAFVSQNLGFTAYEHPEPTADIRDYARSPRGYSLVSTDSAVLGGLFVDHHPATSERIIRLTTHDFYNGPDSGDSDHVITEIVANAYGADKTATARLQAFTGINDSFVDTVRGLAEIVPSVDADDISYVNASANEMYSIASQKLSETYGVNELHALSAYGASWGKLQIWAGNSAGVTARFVAENSSFDRAGIKAYLSPSDVPTLTLYGPTTTDEDFTVKANLSLIKDGGSARMYISSPAETTRQLSFQSSGSQRMAILLNDAVESGSNAGSNLSIYTFDDNGDFTGSPVTFERSSGYLGLNTPTPSVRLDIDDSRIRIRQKETIPATATSGGRGTICWDSDYIYIATALNSWKRIPLEAIT